MTESHPALPNHEMFRPPVNRAMRVLDRSFFRKTVPLAAAKVFENNQIPRCRSCLGNDVLQAERIPAVRVDPNEPNKKIACRAILLEPGIRASGTSFRSSSPFEMLIDIRAINMDDAATRPCQPGKGRSYRVLPRLIL